MLLDSSGLIVGHPNKDLALKQIAELSPDLSAATFQQWGRENNELHAATLDGRDVVLVGSGMGKVNAALAVYEAVREQRPDFVLNVGTAGSATQAVGSILACGRFLDRDMEKVKEFGVPYWYDFSADLVRIDLCRWVDYSHVCNTGDSFVTEVIAQADVVDMENFAVAAVCQREGIPLLSVKYITDRIGENLVQDWEDKLHEANVGLQAFFDRWSAA